LPVLALAALGVRVGIVPDTAIIPVLIVGFSLSLFAFALAVYALIDIWRSGAEGASSAIAGAVYAAPALVLLAAIAAAAIAYPRLADISTDPADPPGLAGEGREALAMADDEGIDLQSRAYPDLVPRFYALPIADVHATARKLIQGRGWTLVHDRPPRAPFAAAPDSMNMEQESGGGPTAAEPFAEASSTPVAAEAAETGLLQAVARTLVFGFPDDVAIRLRDTPDGTRVDMRSASRTGTHDLGQNARRIQAFFADLDSALQPDPAEAEGTPAAGASGGAASQ
jgi:hypothetical protein